MTLIRGNLMSQKGYSPYCGSDTCFYQMPRTTFDGEQFGCKCGWRSNFEADFIAAYKQKWNHSSIHENGEELCVDCNSWPCKAGCPSRIPEQVTLASLPDVWPFPTKEQS